MFSVFYVSRVRDADPGDIEYFSPKCRAFKIYGGGGGMREKKHYT